MVAHPVIHQTKDLPVDKTEQYGKNVPHANVATDELSSTKEFIIRGIQYNGIDSTNCSADTE